MARYKLVTFDVYAALFDLEGSLVPEVRAVLPPEVDPVAFFRLWRSKQLEFALISNSLGRGHLKFKYLTERALEYALKRHNLELPADTRAALVAAWNRLRPWPEAGEVLAGVKARGCLTALLSNGDEAMLRELAAALPVRSFRRRFQAAFGEPPHRWLAHRRIARARRLLQESRLSLSEAALDLGFASQAHFTEAFRRAVGVTPGRYRREVRG